jgi:hypothetical protein
MRAGPGGSRARHTDCVIRQRRRPLDSGRAAQSAFVLPRASRGARALARCQKPCSIWNGRSSPALGCPPTLWTRGSGICWLGTSRTSHGKPGRRCGGRVLPGHARHAETSGRDGPPVLPWGDGVSDLPDIDAATLLACVEVVADRDVRSPTERQGDLLMIGHAADTSDHTVVRASWAEPPFPPPPPT